MSHPIIVTGQESATNLDVLQATRLQAMPSLGLLVVEAQADLNVAANNFTMDLQMPDGSNPMAQVLVPAGTVGQLDERTKLLFSVFVTVGGHAVLGFTETGATIITWRVTFTPVV